ncbi:helix-turn-helix transcriptional regulator [Vibrio sp.]|nr:helix-turn-helix transcriptional regulator [Vibrio sp.]
MEFTSEDRQAIYNVWMSQKAKLRLTQMEMAKRIDISHIELSGILHGNNSMDQKFVERFCRVLHVDPHVVIPSLKNRFKSNGAVTRLVSRLRIEGQIERVYCDGNEVVVEYVYGA